MQETPVCPNYTQASRGIASGPCRNAPKFRCHRCQLASCWIHARKACPKGTKSKYGVLQHLTSQEAERIAGGSRFRPESAYISAETSPEGEIHAVQIKISYLAANGVQQYFYTCPGTLTPEEDRSAWRPDARLLRWFKKKLPAGTLEQAAGEPPVRELWLRLIQQAALTRKPAARQQTPYPGMTPGGTGRGQVPEDARGG